MKKMCLHEKQSWDCAKSNEEKNAMTKKMAQFFSERSLKVIDGFDHLRKKFPRFFPLKKMKQFLSSFNIKNQKISLSLSVY